MYRQIFMPNEYGSSIPLTVPPEWYGQAVEVIAFPVTVPVDRWQTADDDFYKLSGGWDSEQNADEMTAELKASRNFSGRETSF